MIALYVLPKLLQLADNYIQMLVYVYFMAVRLVTLLASLLQITRASFDNEFRSSQSIALGLHRRYKNVIEGGFTGNLQVSAFIGS